MTYYFLKLGQGNNEADSLLGKNPTASIYFDANGETAYERGAGKSQPRAFWNAGKEENRDNTIMVVIHRATVVLLQPAGAVTFGKRFKAGDGSQRTEKTMAVRVLARTPSKQVPPVLASMACSQKYARRTFTRVDHWGNLKAIDWTLQNIGKAKHRRWVPLASDLDVDVPDHWRRFDEKHLINQGPAQLLECLGSTELETLVAKLLEAHGCHVPAHRGGTLGDIACLRGTIPQKRST